MILKKMMTNLLIPVMDGAYSLFGSRIYLYPPFSAFHWLYSLTILYMAVYP